MDYDSYVRRPAPFICPICKGPAVREREVATFGIPTGGPFFDEAGRRHVHDPNGPGVLYYCGEGHDWEPATCWCGWRRYQIEDEINERATG